MGGYPRARTPASASHLKTCRASRSPSSRSRRPKRRSAISAARALASRSPSRSPKCTAATWRSKARLAWAPRVDLPAGQQSPRRQRPIARPRGRPPSLRGCKTSVSWTPRGRLDGSIAHRSARLSAAPLLLASPSARCMRALNGVSSPTAAVARASRRHPAEVADQDVLGVLLQMPFSRSWKIGNRIAQLGLIERLGTGRVIDATCPLRSGACAHPPSRPSFRAAACAARCDQSSGNCAHAASTTSDVGP